MPIAGFQVLMTWRDSNLAINESYIWADATAKLKDVVYEAGKTLMKARSAMMGYGIVPIRLRVSQIGVKRVYYNGPPTDIAVMTVGLQQIQILNPPIGNAPPVGQTVDGAADQAKAAVLADFYSADFSQHSRKFLAGVPDVLIRTDPDGPYVVGDAAWGNLFNAWATILLNNANKWQFKAKPKPTLLKGATFGVDLTTGLLYVNLPTIGGTAVTGGYLQLQGWTMTNKAYISPNGTWQILNVATGTPNTTSNYLLRGTGSVAFSQIFTVGTVNTIDTGSSPFGFIQLGKQTTRKRGNRSLAPVGRRLKPVRVSA
jgi:hypothetical protein